MFLYKYLKLVLKKILILGLILFIYKLPLYAQVGSCDPSVPIFYLDLTGVPDSIWSMQNIMRDGSCCGYNNPPNSCVKFVVTLDQASQGITFNVTDGAVPGNLQWQLMNPAQDACDPNLYDAGVPVCLNGVGPHVIIFCKPGGNNNTYTISSMQAPSVSGDLILNDGCSDIIQALGFDISTIQYNSVFPGVYGAYNNILSCSSACSTTTVTGQLGFPSYVDFQVCGMPFGTCFTSQLCDTVRVYFNPTLTADINPVNPTICFGSNTTNITAIGSGGIPPYSYLWSTGATSQTISVGVGSYSVTINDSTNCSGVTDNVNVTYISTPISANAGSDQVVCTNNFPVQLTGSITGAIGGIWDGGNGIILPSQTSLNITYSPSAQEITNGLFSLNLVTTGNGTCPADTDTVSITLFVFQASLTDSSDISCNGANDGTATAFANTGTPPLSFLWSDGNTNVTNSGMAAGNYDVTVTDNAGCFDVLSVSLYEPPPIIATLSSTTSPCQAALGSAEINPSGGVPGYTYQWDDPGSQTTSIASNLGVGYYNVIVTDVSGCSQIFGIAVNSIGPPYVAISDSIMVSCFNGNDGSATCVITTPGVPPHKFLWNDPLNQTSQTAIALTSGIYTVVVTDSIGCIGSTQVNISEPSIITSIAQFQNVSCFGFADGTASVIGSGGTFPYSFIWSNGQGFANISGLTQGLYYVTITDFNNCQQIDSVFINEPLSVSATASNIQNISCNGLANGSATITGNNGTAPYSFLWSTGQTTASISNLASGDYTVTVSDDNGCTALSSVTISQPGVLSISGIITDNPCYGNTSGSVDVTVSGGTSPFLYGWSDGAVTEDQFFVGAGNYSVTINDANGCSSSQIFVVTQPNAITIYTNVNPISCFGAGDGSLNVFVSGGTPGYSYLWNNGSSNDSINNLQQGTYQLTVTDVNSCTASIVKVINEPQLFSVVLTIPVNYNGYGVSCFGDTTGFINLSAIGGVMPYSYSWSNNTNNIDLYNAGAGNYSVTVTDDHNCTIVADTIISQPPQLTVTINLTDVSCYNASDGRADVTINGGVSGYSVIWSTTATTVNILNIPSGSYWVQVQDSNNCTFFDSLEINQPTELVLSCSSDTIICKNTQAIINADCSGGIQPYNFYWNNTPGINIFTISPPSDTTMSIFVEDNNNCISNFVSSAIFTFPGVNLTLAATDDSICLGNSTQITATISGGYSNDYSLFDMMNQEISSPYILTPNASQDWIFMASDSCNVKAWDTITIYALPVPMITAISVTDVLCYGKPTGSINITVTGGSPGYQFLWSAASTTEDLVNVLVGNYFVQVQDNNNCFVSDTITINEPQELQLLGSPDTLTCKNSNTILQVNASGGIAPYSFFWNGTIGTSQHSLIPASDTTIWVYVTDANNCVSDSFSTNVNVYPNVNINIFTTLDTVCPGTLSQIFANASGGVGPPYSWFNENMQPINIPYTVTPINSQYWVITGMDSCQSKVVDSVLIQTKPVPLISISADKYSGCMPLLINFAAISDPESQSYTWNFGENSAFSFSRNPEHLYNDEGSYDVSLKATTSEGCSTNILLTDLISVYQNPESRFNYDPVSPSLLNPSVSFSNYSTTNSISYWSFGDGDSSQLTDPVHNYLTPGIYEVTLSVKNIQGCKDVSKAQIIVQDEYAFYAPTAFTPDYNEVNDNFSVYGYGIDPDRFTLYIYDRWGELIFKTNTLLPGKDGGMYSEPWNGQLNNSPISQVGSYTWLVQYNDLNGSYSSKSGVVVVLR